MEFSPITLQRKTFAPPGGSANPFDDFEVIHEQFGTSLKFNSLAAASDFRNASGNGNRPDPFGIFQSSPSGIIGASPVQNQQKHIERFDSDEDPFNLFDEDSVRGSPSPNKAALKKRPSSGLRNEVILSSDDEEEEQQSPSEDDSEGSSPRPPVPPRITKPFEWTQQIGRNREPTIPFESDDAELYKFLMNPIEEGMILRMTMSLDSANKTFRFVQDSTHRIVLTAMKRTDGLKAFSLAANFAILMMPTDRSFAMTPPTARGAGSLIQPVKIAKLRGNTLGSQYSLFDQGKSPSKASGVIEVRRELMSCKFEVVPSIYTRRSTTVYLPKANQFRRPTAREEMLSERAKKRDPAILQLSPFVPNTNRLPRMEDYQGFASTHSIKNFMLHIPETKQVVMRFTKANKEVFHVEFMHPLSVVQAFGLALSSLDSKIHPNRQL